MHMCKFSQYETAEHSWETRAHALNIVVVATYSSNFYFYFWLQYLYFIQKYLFLATIFLFLATISPDGK